MAITARNSGRERKKKIIIIKNNRQTTAYGNTSSEVSGEIVPYQMNGNLIDWKKICTRNRMDGYITDQNSREKGKWGRCRKEKGGVGPGRRGGDGTLTENSGRTRDLGFYARVFSTVCSR